MRNRIELVSNWFPPPRWKQHAAQSGYVYQYIFEGSQTPNEYEFLATSGPAMERRLRITLDAAILDDWSSRQRPLSEVESYGIAKMALLIMLDQSDTPLSLPREFRPDYATIDSICRELDL